MSDLLFIKQRDSDYWDNGDYVTPFGGVIGQFIVGREYKIKWIDWDDNVYVDDDRGIENGWHVSQWKFAKEGDEDEIVC